MPAGPRSYGGGSRSSGGSSRGFSSRSSHSGHRHVGPRGPFRMHFGSRVYVVAGGAISKITTFLVFAGIALIFALSGWSTMNENKQYLNQMREDSVYYQNLIETGTVVDAEIDCEYYAFDYNGYGYYQIVYKYKNEKGKICTGQTYANYTTSQIMALNGEIEIAYDSSGFSIPTSYKLNDIEYMYVENQYEIGLTILLVSAGVLALFVFISIRLFVKNLKRENEKHEMEMEKAEIEQEALQKSLQPKVCEYCGYKLSESDKKCENCGARID